MSQSGEQAVCLRERIVRWRPHWWPGSLVERASQLAVASTPSRVIHRENKWRLLAYDVPAATTRPVPILMVPSLINRHYILDLLPGKSLAEFLASQGFVVTVIDWGAPSDEDRFLTFDRCIDGTIRRAARMTAQLAGGEQVILLGYCLGGTMAAIYAALEPKRVAAFMALTTPVDFHDKGLLSIWSRARHADTGVLAEAMGNIPWYLMQASFHMLRPTLNLSKAVGLAQRLWDDAFVDSVLALETWGNDNVSLPGAFYQTLIEDLYQQNSLVKGTLAVAGHRIRLSDITCPVLNVAAEQDNIVPRSASDALSRNVGTQRVTDWVLPGGHIGAVVSRRAATTLWPQMVDWIGSALA